MTSIRLTTFPNGLRVITDTVNTVHSAAVGIWTGVGTRNEDMAHNGAAHMVEHMLFKGTPARDAQKIVEAIEDVGGNMNAYTSREVTSYHVHLLKDHVPLALEVLADMYQNSIMPEDEVERERHVILQEIGMGIDTPDDLVFDHYYETAYPGQALGAPILGKADLIAGMKRETLMEYVRRYYSPARTVVAASGNVDHDEFVLMAEKYFNAMPKDTPGDMKVAAYGGGEFRQPKELEQSHIVLGFEGVGRLEEEYKSAQALSILLGGGMSSRLFQEIREKRGLVYSIYSYHSGYRDSGQFIIYAGTGPGDVKELVPVTCDEILKVSETLTDEEVGRAKAQMKSDLLMGRESMMNRADQLAKNLIYRNEVLDIEKQVQKIEKINFVTVKKLAHKIFTGKPTLAALGPLDTLESFEKITRRLAAGP